MFISILIKLVIGLVALLFVVRLLGKKTLADVTPFDLVYTLILGGIVEDSVYDDAVSIVHVLFALAVWATLIYIVESLVQKNEKINTFIKGQPSVLVWNGQLNLKTLKDNHVEMEQLRSMIRTQGCYSLRAAQHVIMEVGGNITVYQDDSANNHFSYLLVDGGIVEHTVLDSLDKSEDWLKRELEEVGISNIKDAIYAEWSEETGIYVKTESDSYKQDIHIDG